MSPSKRFHVVAWVLLSLLALGAVAPVVSVVAAGAVASHFGCTLNEGDVHPCVIGGVDRGELLYEAAMMGWLALVTVPLGGFLLVACFVGYVVLWQRRRSTPVGPVG
jgi:hypothetical protein